MTSKRLVKLETCSEIHHEKVYTLLSIFIRYVGGCHRKRPSNKYDASANLKFMNWLLSDTSEYMNYEQGRSDRLITKHKLRWLIPLLQKCNGNINFVDNYGQSILFIFLAKYVPTCQFLKKEELIKVTDVITKLLQEGASVNLMNVEGNTPLHVAVKQQIDTSIVKILLENFTEVNACDIDKNTVLHILLKNNKCRQDHTECISILVSKGTDIHKPNKQGSTAVHLAVERCNVEALRIFEKHRETNFSLIRKCGRTMLHLACDDLHEKSSDKVREATIDLLMSNGCDINATDKDGYVPLHYAAKHCSSKIIIKLIEIGANKLSRTKKFSYTPLHLAAQRGRLDSIHTLINIGVDVVAKGGITPLHLALLYREWSVGSETINFLIQNGADVHRRETIFNFSPLHMAVFASGMEIELLIRNGAEINVSSRKGITPLHLASILGNVEVMKILIDHGANLHYRDRILGSTALHWASKKGEVLNVYSLMVDDKCLLKAKMMTEFWSTLFVRRHKSYYDLHDLIYAYGDKVLLNAYIQTDNCVLEMLLRSGAFVNIRDGNGRLPLYYVFKNSNIEGLQILLEFGGDFNDVGVIEVFIEKKMQIDEIKRADEDEKKKKDESKDDEATKEKKKKKRNEKRKINEDLLIAVLRHVIRFKAVNLPIALYYHQFMNNEFLQGFQNSNALLIYLEICKNEVEKMKSHMIDNKISLYNLLYVDYNERSILAKNISTHNLKTKFPEYCNIIRNSCREAIDRMHLLGFAKLALHRISKYYLPDFCSEQILTYLDNESLRTLTDI